MSLLLKESGFLEKLTRIGKKKHFQKKRIVRMLYLLEQLTLSEIIERIDLSTPTVQNLLDELAKEGLVEIKGSAVSRGGRRPMLYGLVAHSLFVLAIDIGRHSTRLAVFDNDNEIVAGIKYVPIKLEKNKKLLDQVIRYANEIVEESGIDLSRIVGVGISMPGLVDPKNGINYTELEVEPSPKMVLENEFNRPVFFINDAQAKALAEYRFGKAKGRQNVMVIHLGSGLGTGIILNGKPYFGTHGFSGEFSHIPVSDNGYLCHCGKRGCLETVASGVALARYAVDGLKAGELSVISSLVDGKLEDINYKTVIHAAARGDQFAIRGIQKIGLELGKGLAILVQILNPELIILGGKFSEAGRYLLNPIEQSLQQYTFPIIRDDVEIVLSGLGDKANLLGSVIHLMENVFEQ